MFVLLHDDFEKAQNYKRQWKQYDFRVITSPNEAVGLFPDLLIMNDSYGLGSIQELSNIMPTIVLAKKVTIELRRRCTNVLDILTENQMLEWLLEHYEPVHEEEIEDHSLDTNLTVSSEIEDVFMPIATDSKFTKRSKNRRNETKLIGVAPLRSTGGGNGKTTLVFNMASYYVKQGKRTLVIDIDPKGVIGDLINADCSSNLDLWENLYKDKVEEFSQDSIFESTEETEYGFRFIASQRDSLASISDEVLEWVADVLSDFFDVIIFDAPSYLNDGVVRMMNLVDVLFLIGLYDRYQYRRYKESIEILTSPFAFGIHSDRIRIVLSRAYSLKNKEIETQAIEKQLGLPVTAIIPEDPLIHELKDNNKSILVEKPNSPYSKVVIPVLNNVIHLTKTNLPVPINAFYNPRKTSWFTRLFGFLKGAKTHG